MIERRAAALVDRMDQRLEVLERALADQTSGRRSAAANEQNLKPAESARI